MDLTQLSKSCQNPYPKFMAHTTETANLCSPLNSLHFAAMIWNEQRIGLRCYYVFVSIVNFSKFLRSFFK